MQLPAISSLVNLLSNSIGGLTGTLKDLFKSTSLVAAAYFALLHLVLIFPPLRDRGFPPIVAFERLPTVWQVLLGTFILLILAFIFTVMGESFLNLLNGRALQDHDPGLAGFLRRRQISRFNRLRKEIAKRADEKNLDAEKAADRLAYEFPDEETDLAPTTLGNILLSPASYTYRQYGARLETIGPILVRKLADEELRKQIGGEMEAIAFLATMSILSILGALELALVVVWFGDSLLSLGWCAVLLIVALVFYYVTFPKARAWGLAIRTAFDLHLNVVTDALKLKELTDPLETQQRWRDVSAWLSIGALRQPSPGVTIETPPPGAPLRAQEKKWYEAAAQPQPLTVKHPPNVAVSAHSEVIDTWPNMPLPNGGWQLAGQEIHYVIVVTNQGEKPIIETSLQVVDTRLRALPVKVVGELERAGGSPPTSLLLLPAALDGPQSLLWILLDIGAGETQVLRYRIRSDCSIRITPGAVVNETEPDCFLLRPTGRDIFAFAIVVMNRNQVGSLYDTAANRLNPYWNEIDSGNQVVQAAGFLARGEIQIHWDGKKFVSGKKKSL